MNKQEDYALSINEVAELLGVSYWTIYAKRHELGFRLSGGRKWYIWRSALDNFGKNVTMYSDYLCWQERILHANIQKKQQPECHLVD